MKPKLAILQLSVAFRFNRDSQNRQDPGSARLCFLLETVILCSVTISLRHTLLDSRVGLSSCRAMPFDVPLSQVHAIHEPAVGEMRDWVESHPTLHTFLSTDRDTELEEKVVRFERWFEIYLHDEEYCKDQAVTHLASKLQCSRVMAWTWMNSEYIKKDELADYIEQAANLFHKRIGFCDVYHPDQYKKNVSVIEKTILLTFMELQGPRSVKALIESEREIVSPAEVPHTNDYLNFDASDDETGDGSNSENI